MFSRIEQNFNEKNTASMATTLLALLTFASLAMSLDSTALAQGNQTTSASSSSSPNQTGAQVTGQPETTLLNKTTIPAQQTNVTVNQTTEPVSPQALQPLENLTQSQSAANLSGIENKTMVTPTGNATTTIVNKTTVPFNQTIVSAGEANQTTGQQQGQGQGQQSNATSSQQSTSGAGDAEESNQTQQQQQGQGNDPLSQMGETLGNIFGQ
jgi:hypothetical protein